MGLWYDWVLPLLGGAGIGLFYFGGLWWTIRRVPEHGSPGMWMFTSFLVRTAVSLAGFYGIMGGEWQRLLLALVGFIAIRLILVKRIKPGAAVPEPQAAVAGASLAAGREEPKER